jgi:hypothetical protein
MHIHIACHDNPIIEARGVARVTVNFVERSWRTKSPSGRPPGAGRAGSRSIGGMTTKEHSGTFNGTIRPREN